MATSSAIIMNQGFRTVIDLAADNTIYNWDQHGGDNQRWKIISDVYETAQIKSVKHDIYLAVDAVFNIVVASEDPYDWKFWKPYWSTTPLFHLFDPVTRKFASVTAAKYRIELSDYVPDWNQTWGFVSV